MDKTEYLMLSHDAEKEIAKQRVHLAILGDAEALAKAFSACPWLKDGDVLEPERGKPHPGLLSTLCSYAGKDACRKFGASIVPTEHSAQDFATLIEAHAHADKQTLFKQPGEMMAGAKFAAFHQGLDANPHLPAGFGSKLYASLASLHSPHMLDGLSNKQDAAWWLGACKGGANGSMLDERSVARMANVQIGESFAMLVQTLRRIEENTEAAQAIGSEFGEAMRELSSDWDRQPQAGALKRRAEDLYQHTNSWRCKLAKTARRVDPPHVKAGIDAALSKLAEPLLAALASGIDPSEENDQDFASAIEARRIQLAAGLGSADGKSLRI